MLIFDTSDNNGTELRIEGENRPLSKHYDNEFIQVSIKNSKTSTTAYLNFDDLVNLQEELTNYLLIIETKMSESKNKSK